MSSVFHVFPAPAKLNLFLHVVGRRSDGYHLLQSVFRLINRTDTLRLRITDDGCIRRTNIVTGVAEANDLCVRAARLLQSYAGSTLGVDIELEKNLPLGGGLGGGSSDAATVLLALNRLWHLNLSRAALCQLALELGADVPFFVFGENAWVEGVGEVLQPIPLPPAWYVVLTPGVQVATAEIFADEELTRDTNPAKISAFFRGYGHNDLEPVVCRKYPAVASALGWLRQFGDARMSGSGASVFLDVETEVAAKSIIARKPVTVAGFIAQGLTEHPLRDFAA